MLFNGWAVLVSKNFGGGGMKGSPSRISLLFDELQQNLAGLIIGW